MEGIDKSKVSRISQELDEYVTQFVNRKLTIKYPYLWVGCNISKSTGRWDM